MMLDMIMDTRQKIIDIWQLSQQGERNRAKNEVIHLLKTQADCVPAWLLLAELLDLPEGKTKCYRHVLRVDPHNRKAREFFSNPGSDAAIQRNTPSSMPELFDEIPAAEEEIELDDDAEVADELLKLNSHNSAGKETDALTAYVIRELGSHMDEDDVIREVSLRGEMDWYEARDFVIRIQSDYAINIAKKRGPLLLIIAIPTVVAGAVWFVITGSAVLASGDSSLGLATTLLQSIQHFTGSIAMILGGSVGIYRVLKSLGKIKQPSA
jgi:hypothetical protein